MDQQIQGANSSFPLDPPTKRKRGRPRKDESNVKRERMPKSNSVSETHRLGANPSNEDDDDDNEMVGQIVSGVCEGSFDAGYFVTVKVGNTDTLLRGAVFVPGLFTPISAANDVAPYAKMYKRKDIPIPVLNPQVQGSGSAPRFRRKTKQTVQPENMVPMAVDQVPVSDVQCEAPFSSKINSASTKVPLTYDVPKNDKVVSSVEVQLVNQKPTAPEKFSHELQSGSLFAPQDQPTAPEKFSHELQSGSLFAPQDQPTSDEVLLIDDFPKIGAVLPSGGIIQGQISTPVVPQKVLTNQQETCHLYASVVETKNDAEISMGEKIQLETQLPVVVPDQVLTAQHHIDALYALDNSSFTAPLTDYLPKNDTNLPSEGVVPIENQVPISADQVLPILQVGAPLTLKDDSVLPQGERVQLEKELPTGKDQVLLSDLQRDCAFAVEKQIASPVILSADKFPRKDDDFTMGGKDVPQETSELKIFCKIIKQNEMFQEMEVNTLAKAPEDDVGATKEPKLGAESMQYVDVSPGNESVIQVTQVQQEDANPPKPVVPEPEYMPFQLIGKHVDTMMEKQASPKNDFPQYIQSEFTIKDLLSGSTAFQSNRGPFGGDVSVAGDGLLSSPTNSQPMMNLLGDSDQVKLKLAAEGSESPSLFGSHISHLVDTSNDLDSGSKYVPIFTKLEINPVTATSHIVTSEDASQTEDKEQGGPGIM